MHIAHSESPPFASRLLYLKLEMKFIFGVGLARHRDSVHNSIKMRKSPSTITDVSITKRKKANIAIGSPMAMRDMKINISSDFYWVQIGKAVVLNNMRLVINK